MKYSNLDVTRSQDQVAVWYDGSPVLVELGLGIPLNGHWLWNFDGSLHLSSFSEKQGSDPRGRYNLKELTYGDQQGPIVRQSLKVYPEHSYLVVETVALRDLHGTSQEDSFFHTTFNSPVIRLCEGLSFLTYTWGLQGGEGIGIGGHFPDAAVASDISNLPEALRRAGFSPTVDLHQTVEKPFAPLIAYDQLERTMVMSPLDHHLISPMRLLDTPRGVGVARGLHGAVDFISSGTTTQTILVFGQGVVPTMLKWGDLMLRDSAKKRAKGREGPLAKSLGFWNCYGGYYAELFRQTNAETLCGLADYFREAEIPVRYFGLDLWYGFRRVGFARDYQPDRSKYPEGLKQVIQDTGLPALLHMSAFDPETSYQDSYEFALDEGSVYPTESGFYRDRAAEFKDWGTLGIWHDFLRTQLQNSLSLRNT